MATIVLAIIMLVLCWPTVLARFAIRIKKQALGLDDWLMGIGLSLSSCSICVAPLRISGAVTVYKWSLYAVMAIATVSVIGSVVGIVASCSPPSAFWDPSTGTCNAVVNAFAAYFVSACSIITDFALAILPAFVLWNIQIRRSLKVSIAIIRGFAAFASCAVIVRLRYLMTLLDNQKFLEDSAKIAIWAVTELMIGIFAGSAPALRPLLRYVPFLSTHGTHDSSQGRGTVRSNGKNQSHVVVETDNFKNGAMVEAKRNQNGHATEDGDSEEYIPQERDASRKMSIRKHVSVKVESSCGAED